MAVKKWRRLFAEGVVCKNVLGLSLTLACLIPLDAWANAEKIPLVKSKSGSETQAVPVFTECVALELFTYSPHHGSAQGQNGQVIQFKKTTKIPVGWFFAGSGGGGGHPTMIVCR